MIRLSGHIFCTNEQDLASLRTHLPDHMRLSRSEPGCLSFNVTQTADPLIWAVEESFRDQAAFDAHQTRTRASRWFAATSHILRDYEITGQDTPC